MRSERTNGADGPSSAGWLGADARDVVHEAHDLLVAEGLSGDRHGPVEARGRLGLEAAEQPEEVVVVLAGEARRLLLPDEPGPVTGGAVVKLGERLPGGDFGGVGGRRARSGPLGPGSRWPGPRYRRRSGSGRRATSGGPEDGSTHRTAVYEPYARWCDRESGRPPTYVDRIFCPRGSNPARRYRVRGFPFDIRRSPIPLRTVDRWLMCGLTMLHGQDRPLLPNRGREIAG